MTRPVDRYEYESSPTIFRPTSNLPELEGLAENLKRDLGDESAYGMQEYALLPPENRTVLDQPSSVDREFVEGVLESAQIENPRSVQRVVALIITDSERYTNYLKHERGTPAGNWHADYWTQTVGTDQGAGETTRLFMRPQAGRLFISLFDDGLWRLSGVIRAPLSRVTNYKCPGSIKRTSDFFNSVRNKKSIIVGENGHFLRGPLDEVQLKGDFEISRIESGQWNYLPPNFVHKGAEVTQNGRVQIFVDIKAGHDHAMVNSGELD